MFQYVSQYCTFFSAIFVLCIDLIIYSVTCSLFTAFVVHPVYFIRNCVVVLIASIFLFVFQSVCLALYHYFILWFYFSSIAYSTFRDCSIIAKTMILIKTCQLMSLSCFFFLNIDICCIVSEVYVKVKILCIALVFLCRHLVVVIFGFGSTSQVIGW